jgi:integrase
MRSALVASDNGIRPVVGRATVGDWLEEWLTTSVAQRNRPRTADSYRDTVRRYIAPALGQIALARLEPSDVTRMLEGLRKRGDLSPTTIRYAFAILRIALGRATKMGRVVRNVATLVDAPPLQRRQLATLSADQIRDFLVFMEGDRFAPLYTAAIGLGLRQGELLGLRWSDVDLDAGQLTVRHTLQLTTLTLAEPKTERARRTLHMPRMVTESLREQRRRQLQDRMAAGRRWVDLDLMFTTHEGRPLMARNVLRSFQTDFSRAGLPRQRFHDLRHAYATLMLADGEEIAIISKTLGHSNISTTADVYAHLTPAMLERSANRMDGILRKKA